MLALTLRILSNPISNALQKAAVGRGASPLSVIFATHLLMSLVAGPALLLLPSVSAGFWGLMVVAGVLAVTSNTLLVAALARSDLSIVGPINAYKPLVSLFPSILLLGEFPSWIDLAGVALILVGSLLLGRTSRETGGAKSILALFGDRGVQLRLAALVLSATEAPFLKRALASAPPTTTFAFWCVFGCAFSVAGVRDVRRAGESWVLLLFLAITTATMQFTTLVTFRTLPVASALALFQISTLLTVVLGHSLFGERDLKKRLMATVVMVAGAVTILLPG